MKIKIPLCFGTTDVYGATVIDPAYGADLLTQLNGEAAGVIAAGAPVYCSADDTVKKAKADAVGTTPSVGLPIAEIAEAPGTGTVRMRGEVVLSTGEWDAVAGTTGGLTPGALYYLSAATAGLMTETRPTTTGQMVCEIGIARSSTKMLVKVSFVDTKITTVVTDLDTAEASLSTAEGEIDTLQSDLDTAEASLVTAEGEIDTLQSDLDTAEASLATAEGEIDALEAGRSVTVNTDGTVGSPTALAATDSRKLLVGKNTSEMCGMTLPAAVAGQELHFQVGHTAGLRIVANTDDTIRIGAEVSKATGYVEATVVGDTLTLIAQDAVNWVAQNVVGTWTVETS